MIPAIKRRWEKNDAETMARIHHQKMVLVLSDGTVQQAASLEQRARDKVYTWEHQVEVDNSQVVRVWGDTAVVTAKLWLKGTKTKGGAINFKLWFSETYIRTPTGWRYLVLVRCCSRASDNEATGNASDGTIGSAEAHA